jgi:hypothetical protein
MTASLPSPTGTNSCQFHETIEVTLGNRAVL